MSYFCSRALNNQPPVKHSIKAFKILYFITLYTLRHYRPAPNVTVTLKRVSVTVTFGAGLKSKSRRLLFEKRSITWSTDTDMSLWTINRASPSRRS